MTRWKAASIHLGVSVLIGCVVMSVVFLVWFPPPYFSISGGAPLSLLLVGVDVVIGPLLTLIVFRAGKQGLAFDLTVIALLQAAAFCYGAYVIAGARPVFVVAMVDRLVPVAAYQISEDDLAAGRGPAFSTLSWTGPRLVGATIPKAQVFELALSASQGKDAERKPALYVPYDQVALAMAARAKPIADLEGRFPTIRGEIDALSARAGIARDEFVYLPVQGKVATATAILSRRDGHLAGTIDIDPW